MSEIRLADGTIQYEGEWLTADELKSRIKEKMDADDMNFAGLAQALEELNKELKNAHKLEVSLILTVGEYERLKELGGGDDNACVMKALRQFLKSGKKAEGKNKGDVVIEPDGAKKAVVKCSKCKKPIEVEPGATSVECPNCGTSGRLKPHQAKSETAKSEAKVQDHYIG